MDFAKDMFDAMPYVSGEYSDSVNTFAINVNILESDKAFRTGGRDRLLASDSSGVIISDARIKRGGRITVGSAVYRIDRAIPGAIPGLSDLKLERISGDAFVAFDATDEVPLDDEVVIDGNVIKVHKNPSVEIEEVGRDGSRVVVSRVLIAIRIQDTVGLGVKAGKTITVDGVEKRAARVLEDGVGFVKVLI